VKSAVLLYILYWNGTHPKVIDIAMKHKRTKELKKFNSIVLDVTS